MNKLFAPFLPPWAETGLQPAFYDLESGTVLQQTARMYDKVNQLIRLFNQLSEETKATVEEYIAKFIELKDFVDTYFDNLDVQEEINNKLDKMAEDGQLADIISQYLNSTALFGYDNVASMKAATNLVNGSFARTLGYTSKNDGGAGLYKIRYITNDDVVDEGSIIEITADPENRLIAELIVEDNTIDVKQFGAIGNGTHDDTSAIQKALTFAIGKKVLINNGIYMISDSLSASGNEISGNAIVKASATFAGNEMLMPHNTVSIDGIMFDCNNYAICALGDSSDCTKLSITNCIFTGAKRFVGENNFALNSCVYLTGKDNYMANTKVNDNLSHGCRIYSKVANSIVDIENCEFNNNGSKEVGVEVVAVGLVQYNLANGTLYDKVTISNCYATGNANSGIAPHSCNNVVIDSCICNENGEHGICLMDGKNGVISNCICDNNYRYGIRIQGDYGTRGQEGHGYKNCIITGNMTKGSGIDIDEDINTIKISDNILTYSTTGTSESIKGIRIGRMDAEDHPVVNANIVNNYFYGFLVYPIQVFIPIDTTCSFSNIIDGQRSEFYRRSSNYIMWSTTTGLKYGESNNVVTYPTDFSKWLMVDGATVSDNVITRGSGDMVARLTQNISSKPRFVTIVAKFSDYQATDRISFGLRFRDSSNTLCSGSYYQMLTQKGNYCVAQFDLSKVSNLQYNNIAKMETNIYTDGTSIKMDYFYAALSSEMPIVPNVIEQ